MGWQGLQQITRKLPSVPDAELGSLAAEPDAAVRSFLRCRHRFARWEHLNLPVPDPGEAAVRTRPQIAILAREQAGDIIGGKAVTPRKPRHRSVFNGEQPRVARGDPKSATRILSQLAYGHFGERQPVQVFRRREA